MIQVPSQSNNFFEQYPDKASAVLHPCLRSRNIISFNCNFHLEQNNSLSQFNEALRLNFRNALLMESEKIKSAAKFPNKHKKFADSR